VPCLPGDELTGLRRVGLYTRVSTSEQDASNQLDRLNDWAAKNNLEVAAKETDRASGKLTVRRGQERLMAEARGHHLHAIAVAKVDRWARSIQHLSTSINEHHELGVDFYAVDQGLTVRKADPTSKLILNVLGAVAEWEASIISERTREGLVGKVGRGRHPKGCGRDFPCPSEAHDKDGEPRPRG